jgi:hypothetical protein
MLMNNRTTRLATVTDPIVPDLQTFKVGEKRVRYNCVTCFPIGAMWRDGRYSEVDSLIQEFEGFNTFRGFEYVMWPGTGWESSPGLVWFELLEHLQQFGWNLELTLLTDDDPARIEPAIRLVGSLAEHHPPNLLLEAGNEPQAHKDTNTAALRSVLEHSGFPYCSGESGESPRFYGNYLTAHTPRDADWPRKCHDLLEYYHGGGPSSPSDPAHHMPCLADEPIRPDQAGYVASDFKAYFGGSALLGGGATFHYESGKYGRLPTRQESECAYASLRGLNAFPPDAPTGAYRRIDEQGNTSRTYQVGDSMVRIRPKTLQSPEPGWTDLDGDGILWRR